MDLIWLMVNAGNYWSPPTNSEFSQLQVPTLRFIVFFTILLMAAKVSYELIQVPLVYLLFKYKDPVPGNTYKIILFGDYKIYLTASQEKNPFSSVFNFPWQPAPCDFYAPLTSQRAWRFTRPGPALLFKIIKWTREAVSFCPSFFSPSSLRLLRAKLWGGKILLLQLTKALLDRLTTAAKPSKIRRTRQGPTWKWISTSLPEFRHWLQRLLIVFLSLWASTHLEIASWSTLPTRQVRQQHRCPPTGRMPWLTNPQQINQLSQQRAQ